MSVRLIGFLLLGKLLIWMARKSPYFRWTERWGFTKELYRCDLCFGFWIYFGLSLLSGERWFTETLYLPIFSEFITAAVASFVMWVFTSGWNTEFREYIIKADDHE